MSDLNQDFLNEYIRLEKLCKDIYKDLPKEELRGVWNYTQDMKNTPVHLRGNAQKWDYHFNELERLRLAKNNWSHEVDGTKDIPFTQNDIEYLRSFRKSILNQTDPISQAHKATKKTTTTKTNDNATKNYYYETINITPSKKKSPLRAFLFWAAFTLGIAAILIYLIDAIIPII